MNNNKDINEKLINNIVFENEKEAERITKRNLICKYHNITDEDLNNVNYDEFIKLIKPIQNILNQREKEIEKKKSKELNKYIDTLESNNQFNKLKKLETTINKEQEAIKKKLVEEYDNKDIEKMTDEEIKQFLITQEKIKKYQSIQNELLETFIKKNNDYGSSNLDKYGKIGILIRLQDKISRYLNISENNIEIKVNETLDDTIKDLINYSYLFLIQE